MLGPLPDEAAEPRGGRPTASAAGRSAQAGAGGLCGPGDVTKGSVWGWRWKTLYLGSPQGAIANVDPKPASHPEGNQGGRISWGISRGPEEPELTFPGSHPSPRHQWVSTSVQTPAPANAMAQPCSSASLL